MKNKILVSLCLLIIVLGLFWSSVKTGDFLRNETDKYIKNAIDTQVRILIDKVLCERGLSFDCSNVSDSLRIENAKRTLRLAKKDIK